MINKLLGWVCIVIGVGVGVFGVYGFAEQGRGDEAFWLIVPCAISVVVGLILVSDDA
jgi:hypothetical protein